MYRTIIDVFLIDEAGCPYLERARPGVVARRIERRIREMRNPNSK